MSRSSFHSLPALAFAPLLALVAGCATSGGGGARPVSVSRVPVVLAAPRGCCKAPSASRLATSLSRRAALQRLAVEPVGDRSGQAAKEVRAATVRARQLYLSMRMEAARKELERALARVREVKARGLTPAELGAIYLLLAAVSDANGKQDDVKRYSQAAVRHQPVIVPDPDTFPPPVRTAVADARRDAELVTVSIQSKPPGALVTWDGRQIGRAPVKIPQQAKGEHFLVVEHPLRAPWEEVIYLSTNASLQVGLKPAQPAAIAGAVARDPALAEDALALLGAKSVVWIEETAGGGLAVRVHAAGRPGRSYHLGAAPTQLELDQAADAAMDAPDAPSAGSGPQRASIFRRYWWAWSLGAAAVIAAGIAIPVAASSTDDPGARGVRLDLP
jgi:PEGA domain